MTVYVCDRCGKKLSYDFLKTAPRYRIGKMAGGNSPFRWDRMWCDLCKNCCDELEQWLEGGKKK